MPSRFSAVETDALLAEQGTQALVADVVDHPLSHQELRQLRQAPGRKRQVMLVAVQISVQPRHSPQLAADAEARNQDSTVSLQVRARCWRWA